MCGLTSATAPGTIQMAAITVPGMGSDLPVGAFRMDAAFATRAEAEAFAALFPKYVRAEVRGFTTDPRPVSVTFEAVSVDLNLAADDCNGGKNETAIKRYRAVVRTLAKHGLEATWTETHGHYNYASQAAFEAAL